MMSQKILPFSDNVFNGLPSIEAADESIQVNNRLQTALLVLGPIFLKHKMQDRWGISLLHNHFRMEFDEIPVQNMEERSGRKSYITRPRAVSFAKNVYPAIFKIDGEDALIPLEYSTDTCALQANNELLNRPEFVEELYQILDQNDWLDIFGLIYGKKLNYQFELVEFNYAERLSILKEVPPEEVEGLNLIQTSWFFSEELADGKCVSKCFSRCVKNGNNHNHDHPQYHDPNG